jgi:hypothetical protein
MPARIVSHLRRNAVAYIALFFALAGTSYGAATRLLPPDSVGTTQVIDRSLLAKDFKLGQLPKGARGLPGPQGAEGAVGPQGPQGDPGTARAYAHVYSDGMLDPRRSKDVLVTHPATGLYCLKPLGTIDETTTIVVATPDYSDAPDAPIVEADRGSTTACASDLIVRTYKPVVSGTTVSMAAQDMAFYAVVP